MRPLQDTSTPPGLLKLPGFALMHRDVDSPVQETQKNLD